MGPFYCCDKTMPLPVVCQREACGSARGSESWLGQGGGRARCD